MKIKTKDVQQSKKTSDSRGLRGQISQKQQRSRNRSRNHQADSCLLPCARSWAVHVDLRFNAAWIRNWFLVDFNGTGDVLFLKVLMIHWYKISTGYQSSRISDHRRVPGSSTQALISTIQDFKRKNVRGLAVFKLPCVQGSINRTESGQFAAGRGFNWKYDRL